MTKIKQFRKDNDMTQVEMAEKLEISQPTLAKMEATGVKKISTAQKYAEKLGTKAIELLDINV